MNQLFATYPKRACAAALTLAVMTIAGCKHEAAPVPAEPAKANLKIEAVHLQNVAGTLELPGRVEADPKRLVHIYAPLSGRLLDMTLSPGQDVKKGQQVAMLESGDVAAARADLNKARTEVARADRALERGKTLLAHEVMSQADFQELTATSAVAHSEEERARQRIHELGFAEESTSDVVPILAPIAGTVLDVGTASGEMQRSLETTNGIATIANLDTIWVTGDVFERDLGSVHMGQSVDILFQAYAGKTFHGTISNIGDALDPATHAVKVRVVLSNPGHELKPGMFATLRVVRAASERVMVPVAAVLHDGDAAEVYVPEGADKYAIRKVTIGATHDGMVEVLTGLNDGDRIVTEGAAFLRQPVGD